MTNLQEAADLNDTVVISARRFEESPFIMRQDTSVIGRVASFLLGLGRNFIDLRRDQVGVFQSCFPVFCTTITAVPASLS